MVSGANFQKLKIIQFNAMEVVQQQYESVSGFEPLRNIYIFNSILTYLTPNKLESCVFENASKFYHLIFQFVFQI